MPGDRVPAMIDTDPVFAATGAGYGALFIETGLVEGDAHYAGVHPETGHERLTDTGVVDEAAPQRTFEPSGTTKGCGQRGGSGLSMVQEIEQHRDGCINAQSTCRGTALRTYRPVAAHAPTQQVSWSAVSGKKGKETILIVEDHAELRGLVTIILEEYGYCVLQAANAGEALAMCGRNTGRIDLVLTDVAMPDTSGLELVARLKRMRSGIKAVFMSGYARKTFTYLLDEDSHFVKKPFSAEELTETVHSAIRAGVDLGAETV